MGLEPMISRTTIWRANQLHHTHHNEPGGIRTLDLRLRRPLLYPAELQTHKTNSLELISLKAAVTTTFKALRKRVMGIEPTYLAWKASVLPLNYTRMNIGVTGFEPATSWSQTRRSSQAEPHPDAILSSHFNPWFSVTQELLYMNAPSLSTTFFIFFLLFLKIVYREFRVPALVSLHQHVAGSAPFLARIGQASRIQGDQVILPGD